MPTPPPPDDFRSTLTSAAEELAIDPTALPVRRSDRLWTGAVALLLVAAAFYVFTPILGWMLLALWTGDLSRARYDRVAVAMHGRARAAGLLTVALVLLVIVPLGAVVASLVSDAIGLVKDMLGAEGDWRAMLMRLVGQSGAEGAAPSGQGGGAATFFSPQRIFAWLQDHSGQAARAAAGLVGATVSAIVGLLIFGITLFATYVGGPDFLALLREASPLGPNVARRLGLAFRETGRGLFIGIGLTSASQATLATVGYAVAGVNRPLAMGVLTFFATLIPGIGLGLIWIPICTALYLTKHTTAAIGLALFMALIVGSIDNFLRPIFARVGRLDLPATVLILAIVSGFMAFGPWGLLWGPLCVRMGVEGLRIAREMRPARVGQTG